MTRPIRFRQWMGNRFNYWGFIEDGSFRGPASDTNKGGINPSEQFTGLHDKNGKEAYEDDIAVHPGGGALCRIVFEPQMGGYGFRDKENAWQGMLRTSLEFEVIGNIYENPELLNH